MGPEHVAGQRAPQLGGSPWRHNPKMLSQGTLQAQPGRWWRPATTAAATRGRQRAARPFPSPSFSKVERKGGTEDERLVENADSEEQWSSEQNFLEMKMDRRPCQSMGLRRACQHLSYLDQAAEPGRDSSNPQEAWAVRRQLQLQTQARPLFLASRTCAGVLTAGDSPCSVRRKAAQGTPGRGRCGALREGS